MQEIIVYRNPAEAAMWNAISGGQGFPIIAGIVVFFAVFLIANSLLDRVRPVRFKAWSAWNSGHRSYTALAVGAVAGIFTIYKMWG